MPDVTIIKREITKAPHKAIATAVTYPPIVYGYISPYPTVVIVITVNQIEDP